MAAKKARKTKKAMGRKANGEDVEKAGRVTAEVAWKHDPNGSPQAFLSVAKNTRKALFPNLTLAEKVAFERAFKARLAQLKAVRLNPAKKRNSKTIIKAKRVTILNLTKKKNPPRKANITSASDLQYAGTAKKATQDGVKGWQLGSRFFPGSAVTKAQKITASAYLDLRTGDVWKRKAKGNPPRFVVQSLKGIKFHHAQGHTRGNGYGVFDIEKGMFVADAGSYHAWDYKQKATAQSIVDQFNKTGPKAPLHYARIAESNPARRKNIAGFMADGVFHPIRSGVEQRTTKSGVRRVKSKKAYKPSKVGEKRTYSAKKSAKRAAQSRRMTAATKQRKATTTRLASRLLDRSGPKAKRRNPNAGTKAAYESFQGKPSTKSTSLNFPNGTPANVYKLGTLHSITLQSGAVVKPAGKTVWLCADTKGKLHLGTSGERLVNAPKGALGKVKEVEYVTTKPHLGDSKPTRYYHELGEETGQKPTLYSDGNGGLLFKGGGTYIRSDGIHN